MISVIMMCYYKGEKDDQKQDRDDNGHHVHTFPAGAVSFAASVVSFGFSETIPSAPMSD
jgi:hypothetical protein